MRYVLVNPRWSFEESLYSGCKEPHLPLEWGYAKAILEAEGHEVEIVDAQVEELSDEKLHRRVAAASPDFTVITTAPSYLSWRCAPPDLRVPRRAVAAVRDVAGAVVIVGPHASTTPLATLRKTGADVAILGECEEILPWLDERAAWERVPSIAFDDVVTGDPHRSDMGRLPALRWPSTTLARHRHHHQRFDRAPRGPGAELESSRGFPGACANESFRSRYRRRPLPTVLAEIDALLAEGVEYLYFADDVFMPERALLEALAARPVAFGCQTRIDLWSKEDLDLLGRAGCVSLEAEVESCSFEELVLHARRRVAVVQARLPEGEPRPAFPYPGSPDYRRLFGEVDDDAWERALDWYLQRSHCSSGVHGDGPPNALGAIA